jgi:hypothetical protein
MNLTVTTMAAGAADTRWRPIIAAATIAGGMAVTAVLMPTDPHLLPTPCRLSGRMGVPAADILVVDMLAAGTQVVDIPAAADRVDADVHGLKVFAALRRRNPLQE